MAIDREKTLQAAAKLVDKKKYDKAIVEYQKIVQSDPSDTRTLLKIGDLQTRLADYPSAIATYDRVAQYYVSQGFQLKAIAVFKQVRELIKKHAPDLAPKYSHITPRLAEIYAQLNLVSDALSAFDEVATSLQKSGRDREAIAIFRKIVGLDPKNPLSHLRLAEAACRVQELDTAIDAFWTAAGLLLGLQRPEDALKVIERILHFRQDPIYARAAAELYLKRDQPQAGMQALAKLQIAFQANPKDLDTLALLAQAFEVIGQPDKAFAVHVEMARLAREQQKTELFIEILRHLKSIAPSNDQVLALERLTLPGQASQGPVPPPPPKPPAPPQGRAASLPPPRRAETPPVRADHLPPPAHSRSDGADGGMSPPLGGAEAHSPQVETIDIGAEVDYIDEPPRLEQVDVDVDPEQAPMSSVPVGDGLVDAEERGRPPSFQPSAHAHKAVTDSEAFRRLGLLDKAVEVLHIALELDPNSVPIRQKLREILVEAGEREPAIVETLNIAIIHLHNQDPDAAEPLIYEVLEIEPEHPDALNVLAHVQALREGQVAPADGHFESYDIEGVPPASAIIRDDAPLPAFPLSEAPTQSTDPREIAAIEAQMRRSERPQLREEQGPLSERAPLSRRVTPEAIEEVLEEAEFFASQGLYADAEAILSELLALVPHHILLRERLEEVRQALENEPERAPDSMADSEGDQAFSIAASLDALDGLEQPTAPKMQGPTEEVDVDQVFAKFKEGVKATVDESDAATHYDLGVAYQEMGLLVDAQSEFELASRDPQRTCMCFYMIGSIHVSLGNFADALTAYKKALLSSVRTTDQEKNLLYEMALVYERKGDNRSYVEHLKKVAQVDPGYRDVSARIRALGASIPDLGPPDDEVDQAFDNLFG